MGCDEGLNTLTGKMAIQKTSSWRPIETAPNIGRFLAIFDKEIAICCDCTDVEDNKRWFRSDLHGAYPIDEISYWMPLPEPPTEINS